MTKPILQPYKRMEAMQVQMLAKNGYFYWVSQSYERGSREFDHTKTAILFTPYKELKDASKHYHIKQADRLAAILDVRRKAHTGKLLNLCTGGGDIIPFIALVGNTQPLDNLIRKNYYEQYRAWVKKNRTEWNLREHNAIDPHFITVFGEPAVKITYGTIQYVIVLLEELEKP